MHRCVKYDPLTPASAILKQVPQSVLDGVLTLYEAYALTVPQTCLHTCIGEGGTKPVREAISQQPPTCGVTPWCQVLDPALAGLCHSLNPNVILTSEGQLVAARAIVAGEQLTCDFGGHMRMHISKVEHSKPSGSGKQMSLDCDTEPASAAGVSRPTATVLDGLATAIHAAACVCLNAEEKCHRETRQACCPALSSEWVATRLQNLVAVLQRSGTNDGGQQCHWGLHAARAVLLRMSFATCNTVED